MEKTTLDGYHERFQKVSKWTLINERKKIEDNETKTAVAVVLGDFNNRIEF